MNRWHQTRHTALGLCVALAAGQPALADDTEIFVGRSLDSGSANVLFLIDTSGSMGATVDWESPYDPDTTYAGSCATDRIYWTEGTETPSTCDPDDNQDWVYAEDFVCQEGLTVMATGGKYSDRMAQYKADKEEWNNLKDEHDWIIDCAADSGRHGDGSSEVATYAAEDEDAPYHTEPDGPNNIDWSAQDEYTAYSGNYLNYELTEGSRTFNRLDIVKLVARNTLGRVSGINVGMMRFDRYAKGGMVTRAVSPIAGEFDPMTTALDNYEHGGGTPLAETLYEAGQYFSGRAVEYGLASRGNRYVSEPSVAASRSGSNYVSPIANQCQKNFVVLLTDGEPSGDTDANSKIAGLPGFKDATGQTACSGNCLDEMAAYMRNHDMSPLDGDQHVETFTIGFHTKQTLLEDTARRGGGEYFTADSAEELTDAFVEILDNIIERDVTFTAPAVAVNTFNRLTHRSELYISMFKPTPNPHWEGNVKRYRLDNSSGAKKIYDATGRPAINPDTGTFFEDAKSYWTLGSPDGFDTTLGGLRNRLHADRNVYTVTSGATRDVPLAAPTNRMHESNLSLTDTLLGIDSAERDSIIRWARGVAADDTPMNILGDALHSRPIVMSWGGSETSPDLSLFYITNDGYFHAVDPTATSGETMEIFSFIPPEILPRLPQLRANLRNNPPKFYGLDGQLSSLILGDDGDGVVESGETALVFFGMRRGGNNYYALNVSDRANPRLAWSIIGGEGDFTELGQTWSEMTPARVKIGGSEKDVLFFGGGYDTGQDPAGSNDVDAIGRAIYMVDASTGNLLWWAANSADHPGASLPLSDMTNSIPSDLRVIDINGDHLDDRIYVGDMTGQLWRFDIDNETSTSASDLITGGVIADIAGASAANNRRIFYPPSVSLIADDYLGNFLALSFGTGHRANPLGTSGKTVKDRFYMLRDPYVFHPPLDATGDIEYRSIDEGQLLDVTTNLDPSTADLNDNSGWYIRLDNEEKVLAKSLTADGRIFFTSYLPDAAGTLSCNPTGALGSARSYVVDIGSGEPRFVPEPPTPPEPPVDSPECGGRCGPTVGPIPPEPVLVFTEPDDDPLPCPPGEVCDDPCDGIADVALVIGTDVRDPSICTAPVRTYWYSDDDT